MLRAIWFFGAILYFSTVLSQELELKSANMDEFPIVEFKVHARNPEFDLEGAIIVEEEKEVVPNSITKEDQIESEKGKTVLFIIENHYLAERNVQREYFSQIVNALESAQFEKGDEIIMASFDWERNDTLLFFANSGESIDLDEFKFIASNMQAKSSLGKKSDKGKSSELYRAMSEALEFLEGFETDNLKSLFVMSGEFSYTFAPVYKDPDLVIDKSLELNIPIYSLGFDIGMNDKYSLKEVCEKTYGESHTGDLNWIDESVTYLQEALEDMANRSGGSHFIITYTSSLPKDGKDHSVILSKSGKGLFNHVLSAPSKSFGEQIKDNLIVFLLLIIALIGSVVGVFLFLSKKKKERIQKEREQTDQLEQVKQENERSSAQLKAQDQKMKLKEEQDKQKELAEKKRKEREQHELYIESQLKEMRESGLPHLRVVVVDNTSDYEINAPTYTIGREGSNNVVLELNTVSKLHAQIVYSKGQYTIYDLGSTNGVQVNGIRKDAHQLEHNDVFEIGGVNFTYLK